MYIPFSESELIDCLAIVPSLVSLEIEFRGLGNTIDDRLLRILNVNLPGHILPRLSALVFQGPSRISGESLDALVMSRRDINLVDDRVALLETLTLDCSVPQGWSTHQFHSFNQRFLSKGLSIRYGQDWWIFS
ncbi:hypothetical protein BD779DRAFT_1674904 [Infundibulicybe gibba]|nr:hypothetical protein BD779DRAFT_1674904 [Infundibulicybe gibba]